MSPVLIDECTQPPLRAVIGRLLGACTDASVAIGAVRLAVVDLTEREMAHVQRCRILIGRLDARSFEGIVPTPSLQPLYRFLTSPRVEIRSIGLGTWLPDFSIYRNLSGRDGPAGDACLVGAHYFREPPPGAGAALTCLLTEPAPVRVAMLRFEQLWETAYDVGDTVRATVEQFAHAR